MPRFYCDYCDIFLTHDSSRVRGDHNSGWKHKMHVQNYFTELDAVKVQQVINSITKAYVYAGLGGFPELPVPGQRQQPTPVSQKSQITNVLSFSPPPGFRPPVGFANQMPPGGMMPPPFMMGGMPPPPGFMPGVMPPPGFMPPPGGLPNFPPPNFPSFNPNQ